MGACFVDFPVLFETLGGSGGSAGQVSNLPIGFLSKQSHVFLACGQNRAINRAPSNRAIRAFQSNRAIGEMNQSGKLSAWYALRNREGTPGRSDARIAETNRGDFPKQSGTKQQSDIQTEKSGTDSVNKPV